jgi:hypothetical protein
MFMRARRGVKIVVQVTLGDTPIMGLLKWMLNLSYCEYNRKHYILKSGSVGLGTTVELFTGRTSGSISNICVWTIVG